MITSQFNWKSLSGGKVSVQLDDSHRLWSFCIENLPFSSWEFVPLLVISTGRFSKFRLFGLINPTDYPLLKFGFEIFDKPKDFHSQKDCQLRSITKLNFVNSIRAFDAGSVSLSPTNDEQSANDLVEPKTKTSAMWNRCLDKQTTFLSYFNWFVAPSWHTVSVRPSHIKHRCIECIAYAYKLEVTTRSSN